MTSSLRTHIEHAEIALVIRCACALALLLATTTLMNASVFPLFDDIYTFTRDISVTCAAVALLALGFIAYRFPRILTPHAFVGATFVCIGAGAIVLTCGLITKMPPLVIAGACLFSLGRAGATVFVGLSLSKLSMQGATVAICAAFIGQYICGEALIGLPLAIPYLGYCIYPIIATALSLRLGLPLISLAHTSDAPSDLAVIRPYSFLAPFSALFICLFLFQLAFGFSLRFGEEAGVPQYSFLTIVPPVLVAGYVIISKKRYPADMLVRISALFVIGGFLLAAGNILSHTTWAASLLSAGNVLFSMTAWMALVAIAARNPVGATTVITWGRGVSAFGTLVGAAAGVAANDAIAAQSSLLFIIAGALLMAFAAYVIIGLSSFTFSGIIEGVQPVIESVEIRTPTEIFDERCATIAHTYNLTPREKEVFAMLARGRNREYIEEELVVSRNTVKAHVKHIYAKLNIHSHQQLIDLIEGDSPHALQ